jgi:ribonuclease HI
MKYNLAERCSNNQAEQLAIAKALEKTKNLHQMQGNQRSLAIQTESRVSLDALTNPNNHPNLLEGNAEEIRRLENDNWIIHFT